MWDRGYDDYLNLENSSFSAVKVVKHADIDKYKYSGYGIGFCRDGNVSICHGFSKNLIIFGVYMTTRKKKKKVEKIYSNSWWRPYTSIIW